MSSGWERFTGEKPYKSHADNICYCGHILTEHLGLGSEEKHKGIGACLKCNCSKFTVVSKE